MDDTFRKRERFPPQSPGDSKSRDLAKDWAEWREGIDYQNQQPSDRNSHGERTPAGPKIGPDVPGHRDRENDKWYERHAKRDGISFHGRRLQHPELGESVPCCTKSRQREEEMDDFGASPEPNRQMDQRQCRAHSGCHRPDDCDPAHIFGSPRIGLLRSLQDPVRSPHNWRPISSQSCAVWLTPGQHQLELRRLRLRESWILCANRSTTPREFQLIHYRPALNNAFGVTFL